MIDPKAKMKLLGQGQEDMPMDLKAKKDVVMELRKLAMQMMGDHLQQPGQDDGQDPSAVVAKLDVKKIKPDGMDSMSDEGSDDSDVSDLKSTLDGMSDDDQGEDDDCNTPEAIDQKIQELLAKKKQLQSGKAY